MNTLPRCSVLVIIAGLALMGAAAPEAASPAPAPAAAPANSKNTYVIVHGAWGGGFAFKAVDDLLTADGNKVYRPTLTGQGEKIHLATPDTDLNTHIQDIVNVILWENLHDVVLVGHSYGGMVITGVADRIPDRIKCIIYLDAFLPENGESLNTAGSTGAPGSGARLNLSTDAGGFILYSGFNVNNQAIPRDVPMPPKTLSQPIALMNQDAVKKIPTSYAAFHSAAQSLEQAQFYRFYQRAQARGWNMLTLVSDHNAHRSHPQDEVNLLEKAVATMAAATATPSAPKN